MIKEVYTYTVFKNGKEYHNCYRNTLLSVVKGYADYVKKYDGYNSTIEVKAIKKYIEQDFKPISCELLVDSNLLMED